MPSETSGTRRRSSGDMAETAASTARSRYEREAGYCFSFCSARIHTSVFSGTYEEISSPSALLLRIRLADANAPCALSLSWSIAIRCTVCGTILELNDKIALQYSIPKMQFGFVSSSAVSAPSAFFTASVRAAANETPFATSGRISELNTSECRYSAQCMRGVVSPVSLPNVSVSTQPSAFNNEMPPSANFSAPATAHGKGSSSTSAAPFCSASRVRDHLSSTAASPRCTKFPLIAQTMSLPNSSEMRESSAAWPLCSGLNSQTTPEILFFPIIL